LPRFEDIHHQGRWDGRWTIVTMLRDVRAVKTSGLHSTERKDHANQRASRRAAPYSQLPKEGERSLYSGGPRLGRKHSSRKKQLQKRRFSFTPDRLRVKREILTKHQGLQIRTNPRANKTPEKKRLPKLHRVLGGLSGRQQPALLEKSHDPLCRREPRVPTRDHPQHLSSG